MNIGGPELVVVLIMVVSVVVPIATIIDVATKPDAAFQASGVNKTLWIVLPVVGIFICAVGLVVGLVWFLAIRPKVVAAGGTAPY